MEQLQALKKQLDDYAEWTPKQAEEGARSSTSSPRPKPMPTEVILALQSEFERSHSPTSSGVVPASDNANELQSLAKQLVNDFETGESSLFFKALSKQLWDLIC